MKQTFKILAGLTLILAAFTTANATSQTSESPQSQTANTLSSTLEAITQQSQQSGGFTQERWIKILETPLVSKGQFAIQKGKHIEWQLNEPFALKYEFDGETLSLTEDGKTSTISGKQDPSLYGFFVFLFNIYKGEISDLEKWFDVKEKKQDTGNTIQLTPQKAVLKKAFQSILIQADHQSIEKITITENSEDKIVIQFTGSD